MPDTNISAAMRAAVGTELARRVSYPVGESDIRRWAVAVYWPESPPDCFLVKEPVAPAEFNPFAWAVAEQSGAPPKDLNDPDNVELMAGIPGPGLRFMLNGGLDTEYGEPILPGDVITSVRRLGPYTERAGNLGLMLFSSTEDTWTNQRGEFVARTVNTIIRY